MAGNLDAVLVYTKHKDSIVKVMGMVPQLNTATELPLMITIGC